MPLVVSKEANQVDCWQCTSMMEPESSTGNDEEDLVRVIHGHVINGNFGDVRQLLTTGKNQIESARLALRVVDRLQVFEVGEGAIHQMLRILS